MSFDLEKDMIPVVEKNLIKILCDMNCFNSGGVKLVANELPVSYRMIDMAITSIDLNTIEKIRNTGYSRSFKTLNTILLDILSVFYIKQKVSTHYFRKTFCISMEKLRILLKELVKLGLIEQISRYMYIATEWVEDVPEEIIAIELKLSKWQEALEQGVYNLNFADYSLVILDEEKTPKTKDIEEHFVKNNVGLVYANTDGYIKYAYMPQRNKNKNNIKWSFQKVKVIKDLCNTEKWNIVEAHI